MRRRAFRSGRARAVLLVAVALLVTAAAVLLGGGIYRWMLPRHDELHDLNRAAMLHMTGLGQATANRLDPARFTDADGDLVADAPADAAQLIDPPTLTFSYIPAEDPEAYRTAWRPFVAHLSKVVGRPVEYVAFDDVDAQLRAIRDGRLHVAGLNAGSVPTAVNACGFVPVATLPSDDGSGTSRTEIIVPADGPLRSAADLRGGELTLTAPGSNSGYKAPLVLLRSDASLEPGRDYTLRYSGGHDQSIDGIVAGQYRAAAVAGDMVDRAARQGRLRPDAYRTIYASERFPTAGIGHVHNLRPALAAKVREAIETFDWGGTTPPWTPAGGRLP